MSECDTHTQHATLLFSSTLTDLSLVPASALCVSCHLALVSYNTIHEIAHARPRL